MPRPSNSRRYQSAARRREARLIATGYAILVGCGLMLAALIYGAYSVDTANGVSVDQSLRSAGL